MKRIIALVLVLLSFSVSARWANPSEAPVELISSDISVYIRKDGSSETIVEKKIKIINELGREAISVIPLTYNKDNTVFEILEANTINGGKKQPLDKDSIEDKPLASEMQGFDQKHQVLLAFPNVKVGSVIHFKYKSNLLKSDIPGFDSNYFTFGRHYTKTSSVNITSELPIHIDYNDPDKYLRINKSTDGKLHKLSVTLTKPIFVHIVDEEQNNVNPKHYPWVYTATSDDWDKISSKIADPFIKITKQPLPALYQEIVKDASDERDPLEQINIVMSKLNQSVQYMGDWKSTSGRMVPQPLARVAQRRTGDCKDFATGTVVMLRELGFQADVALVRRAAGIFYNEHIKLPGLSHYDHAIVKTVVNGKVYWIDPTNFISTTIVLPDIADRPSLVLAENPKEEYIPQSTPVQNYYTMEKIVDLNNPALANISGTLTLYGISAAEYTGSELRISKNMVENAFFHEVGNYDFMLNKSVQLPDLSSRIVRDLVFKYKYTEKDSIRKSNAGIVIGLSGGSNVASDFIFHKDTVSDIYLGPPSKGSRTYVYKNVNPAGTLSLDNSISNKWVDLTRTVTYGKDVTSVKYDFEIKKAWIANDEINTAEFKKMADKLSKEFSGGISIIFAQPK